MKENKVLLVNATGGAYEEYGSLAKASPELPQLGIAAIAASLEENNIKSRIIDTHLHRVNIDKLLSIIKNEGYDVVGFSVYITTICNSLLYAKAIKERFNNIKICFGGPQVTLDPYSFFKPFIDYIFIGEGDYSLVELVKSISKGNIKPNIKGLLFSNGDTLEGNYELNLVEDIDSLPFIDLDKYYDTSIFYPSTHIRGKKVINIVSARGCPYKCTFCAASEINGRKVRSMSIENFLNYLQFYKSKGYDSFVIYDDTFTINKKRVMKICEGIINKKLNIKWNCWARVDCINEEMLKLMKDAGCYHIMFGCESLNNKTLDILKKGFNVDQCFKGIEMVKKVGILVSSSFMIGLPGETRMDIMNTINDTCKTKLDYAFFPIFEPYLGTPIYETCKSTGRWLKSKYINRLLSDQNEIWVPNTISREEIENLARYAFKSFYLRRHFLLNTLPITLFNLPLRRKITLISSGIDYFLLSRFRKKRETVYGSRYN